MNHDTVLRACEKAREKRFAEWKRMRQFVKFHTWLVRRDTRLTTQLEIAKGQVEFWKEQAAINSNAADEYRARAEAE